MDQVKSMWNSLVADVSNNYHISKVDLTKDPKFEKFAVHSNKWTFKMYGCNIETTNVIACA